VRLSIVKRKKNGNSLYRIAHRTTLFPLVDGMKYFCACQNLNSWRHAHHIHDSHVEYIMRGRKSDVLRDLMHNVWHVGQILDGSSIQKKKNKIMVIILSPIQLYKNHPANIYWINKPLEPKFLVFIINWMQLSWLLQRQYCIYLWSTQAVINVHEHWRCRDSFWLQWMNPE
jgi:hypothetical protein